MQTEKDLAMATSHFKVPDMDCPTCVEKIERAIRTIRNVEEVSVNLMSQTVRITHGPIDQNLLKQTIQSIGYTIAEDRRAIWSVPDMECAGCAEKVERAIQALTGVSSVTTSVMSQKVTVTYDPTAIAPNAIAKAIGHAGYTPGETTAQTAPSFWQNREQVLTCLSGIFFFAGLITTYLFPDPDHAPLWTGHLTWMESLYLIAAILGGFNFFPAAFRALKSFSLDMDFLMASAIVGAALIGEHMEAAAIAFLFSTAELLEDYAVARARRSLHALMELAPDTATVVRSGIEITLPVEAVERDERVLVRPGEKVPLDGTVIKGTSTINQAPITGESMPVAKQVGDRVFAGTINCEGYVEIRAEKLASESTFARIIQLVEEAEEKRAPSEQFVRKFARYYTPVVTFFAIAIMLIPALVFGADFNTYFVQGLTLLVIACPCALVISTPVAVISGITSAARNGVLIKGGNHLETLGNIKVIAFDKTGTLTQGQPEVTDIITLNGKTEQDVLSIAAALEYQSKHPIAQAIIQKANGCILPPVTTFESLTGKGVSGYINGTEYMVGKPDLFPGHIESVERLQQEGKTTMVVGTRVEPIGIIAVSDTVRPSAKNAITALRAQGIQHIVMLTGDNEPTAKAMAEQLGIAEWQANLLPEDKVAALENLRKQYGPVAMIGDGVNDAPALATANVGIAMGAAGTATALETADVALMADDLSKLPYLFQLTRKSRTVIHQNVAFSILVKMALAIGVFPGAVSLVIAVLVGDMGTALTVTGNALRLARLRA